MKNQLLIFKNPQFFAWTTYSLLSNNEISKNMFTIFAFTEQIIILYYNLHLLARSCYDESAASNSTDGLDKINLNSLVKLNNQLINATSEVSLPFIGIVSAFLFFYITIIASLLISTLKVSKQHINVLDKPSKYMSILCSALVIFSNILFLPMMEVHLRGFNIQSINDSGNVLFVQYIAFQIINIIALVCHLFIVFYCKRLFMLNMPETNISWSAPDSNIIYIKYSAKLLTIISFVVDYEGKFLLYEIIALMVIRVFLKQMKMTSMIRFNQRISHMYKQFDGVVLLILIVTLINFIFRSEKKKGFLFIIGLVPFMIFTTYQLEKDAKKSILMKLKDDKITSQVEAEYVLCVLMQYIVDLNDDKLLISDNHSWIVSLVENHQLKCSESECICQDWETFLQLMKESQKQKQNIFMIHDDTQIDLKLILDGNVQPPFKSDFDDSRVEVRRLKSIENQFIKQQINQVNNIEEVMTSRQITNYQDVAIIRDCKGDANQLRIQFFTRFCFVYYQQFLKKYPSNFQILMVCSFYSLFYLKKSMHCVNMMRNYNKKNLSMIQKQVYIVNELYLVKNLSQHCEIEYKVAKEDIIDEEYFIKINDLNDQFVNNINHLSETTVDFWQMFLKEDIDIYNLSTLSKTIAVKIKKINTLFHKLDNTKKSKSFKLYYLYAIMQLNILNNEDDYQLYISKAKQIRQMDSYSIKVLTQNLINDDYGFLIVDANMFAFGKIVYINYNLATMLGYELKDTGGATIYILMPELIKASHHLFEERFLASGNTSWFNRRVLFAKNASGYLVPVQLVVKFSYTQRYGYTFLAVINGINDIIPFKNEIQYPTSQLMFLLMDLKHGQIHEVSQTFADFIKKHDIKHFEEQILNEKKMNVKGLLSGFNFKKFIANSEYRRKSKQSYENIHILKTHQKDQDGQKIKPLNPMRAKVTIFEESYSNGILKLGYIVLSIIESEVDIDQTFSNVDTVDRQEEQYKQDILNRNNLDEYESSNGSQAGAQSNDSSDIYSAQSFQKRQLNKRPRQVILVTQFLLFLLIIIMAVSTGGIAYLINNLDIFKTNIQSFSSTQQFQYKIRQSSLIMRNMLNIANGYENNTSSMIRTNRFSYYQNTLQTTTNELKAMLSIINSNNYPLFSMNRTMQQDVTMYYLNSQNQIYSQQQTPLTILSLYLQRLQDFINLNQSQMIGKTQYIALNYTLQTNYTPSNQEQIIYYLTQNGISEIRLLSLQYASYLDDSIKTSLQNLEKALLILNMLSIASIIIVGIFITPIISRAERNRYLSLQFFLKLQIDDVKFFIDRINFCQDSQGNNSAQIHAKSELKDADNMSEILLKSADMDFDNFDYSESPLKNNSMISHIKHQSSKRIFFQRQRSFATTQQYDLSSKNQIQEEESSEKSNEIQGTNRNLINIIKNPTSQFKSSSFNPPAFHSVRSLFKNTKSSLSKTIGVDFSISVQEAEKNQQNDNQVKSENFVNKSSDILDDKTDNKLIDQSSDQLNKNNQLSDEDSQELGQKNLEDKYQKIGTKARQVQRNTLILMAFSLALFAIYFILQYLIAKSTIKYCTNSIEAVNIIFNKLISPTDIFLQMDLNIVTNKTLVLYEDPSQSAIDFYMTNKDAYEIQYTYMRKNYKDYIKDTITTINLFESNQLCKTAFSDNIVNQDICNTALNGLFQNGLTNSQFYMYQVAQSFINNFDQGYKLRIMNVSKLLSYLQDSTRINIVDSLIMILSPIFTQILNTSIEVSQESVKQINYYQIALYIVFMVVILICLILYIKIGYDRIQKSIWNTNIMLKMIPLSALEDDDIQKFKQFTGN